VPAAKSVNVTEGTELLIKGLLVGVTDVDGPAPFTLVNASSPAHGTLSGLNAAAGEVTYTPAPGYFGPDSFVFTVKDAAGATGSARVDIAVGECIGWGWWLVGWLQGVCVVLLLSCGVRCPFACCGCQTGTPRTR
jgi:hypothetical protein